MLPLETELPTPTCLRTMLREEKLDPATIRSLMRQYRAEGQWNYQKSKKQERLELMHTGERVTAANQEGMSSEAPKPRTFDVCKWRGTDVEGTLPAGRPHRAQPHAWCSFHRECVLLQQLCE